MWTSVDLFYEDDQEDHQEELHNVSIMRRNIRDTSNPLSLSDNDCVKFFRLNKRAILYLVNLTKNDFKMTYRSTAVSPILKICASLRFLATGSYQQCVGNDMHLGLSQPVVSTVLTEFLEVMERKICPLWIKAEMTEEEKQNAKRTFFLKSGIPGITQVIDGTHVKIIAPGRDVRHVYYNRKGFFSLNALIACDHECVIRFIEARYPGSYHDAFIWNICALRRKMYEDYESGERQTWLLGDAGFPQENVLLTPYRNTRGNSREQHFNHKHSQARSIIERVIGILKARFRCLLGARELHYAPKKATSIVNVCVALHNICRAYRLEDPPHEVIESVVHENDNYYNGREEFSATRIRDNIRDSL